MEITPECNVQTLHLMFTLSQHCTINELIKGLVISSTSKVTAKLLRWQRGNGASNAAA